MKNKYTFWELLKNYKIEIPKIQRDYAQGRKEPSIIKIVDNFLEKIKASIKEKEELNLDFVYGRVNNEIFIPLDGQQRLTTLFLVHWYIALKEGKLGDDNVKQRLLKFTYETRVSSEDFCKNLVSENIDYNLLTDSVTDSVSKVITDSKWYFLSWELDPTVSAMLNMLDLIHSKFKNIEELSFEQLEKGEKNITFQFLPLEKFKLTDELYIKMNARGKPLTEFENFKANFSDYLEDPDDKAKLDNVWLDIFWNLELKKNVAKEAITTENIDIQFFSFFKNITLNFYTETKEIDKSFIDHYDLFDTYSEVYQNRKYIDEIKIIFDGLIQLYDNKDILDGPIAFCEVETVFTDFLLPNLNYWQRLRFYSLSCFFIKYGAINEDNKVSLNNWLRVTKNLINNTLIQSPEDYRDAIRSIHELSENISKKELSDNISEVYAFVGSLDNTISYFLETQREEECLKASLILEDSQWEKLFINVEQHPYFDGQIGFILQYSTEDGKSFDQDKFKDYSDKLSVLFGPTIEEKFDFLFQRALLSIGDYLPKIGNNNTFCLFNKALRAKQENWRKVFNDKKGSSLFLKNLLNRIHQESIVDDLKQMIEGYEVNDWRKPIIKHSYNIEYCQSKQIRKYSDDVIYLLSKQQMNSYHREIYSWDLFKREFENKKFLPFSDESHYGESASWDQPYIYLSSFHYEKIYIALTIKYNEKGTFILELENWAKSNDWFSDRNSKFLQEDICEMSKQIGFEDNKISIPEKEIVNKIKDIYGLFKPSL